MAAREALEKVHLFRGAQASDLDAVVAISKPVVLGIAETIYLAGAVADHFYVVEFGSVDLRLRDRETVVMTFTAGQPFGEAPFFHPRKPIKRLCEAVTHEASRLLRIEYADLERVLAEHPVLALNAYRNATAYFVNALTELAPEITHRFI